MAVAISLPPTGLPMSDCVAYAREAESLGYTSCWVAEVGSNDAFALGCAVAAGTETMRIGTAVSPMNIRGVALLAQQAATLQAVSGGRAVCGIGVSSEQIVARWNAQSYDRHIRRTRETIEVLRRIFAGERVDYTGECLSITGYRLAPAPSPPVPIYIGALNKQMLRLGARMADGIVVNMFGERFAPEIVREVHRAAEKAGRDPASIEIVMRVQTVVDQDPAQARELFARGFGAYIIAPGYDRFFTWQGFGETVEGVRKAFAARDREASRKAVSDEMLHDLVLAGDAATVKSRFRALMDAGITTPAAHNLWITPESAWHTMRSLAPAT